ncbi:MAG: Crp/Fnr family transcriptional regulator [Proteobacteria bacterium]|nr:MAG: Crp/Fnr family transcriptional regulator [Pseudomonadota bacterium]
MRERLKKMLAKWSPETSIPDAEWNELADQLLRRDIAAGDYFEKAGNYSKEICFVERGLFRSFYNDNNGDEFIKNFTSEGKILGSFASLYTRKPSDISIQAIESSIVWVLEYARFEAFFQKHPHWQTCGRILAQQVYLESERKEHELLVYDAGERYERFLKSHEAISKRIHQYMIAMYLGISPVSLSRIINSTSRSAKS